MESEKPAAIDEKNALAIEEMEKSLHNMEQSLGMDHPVVGKILDSYAKLLRQNNIRHLDALNMEARAKAIRAKNNQKEAEAQGGLKIKHEERSGITAGHLRMVGWLFAVILLAVIGFGASDFINKSSHLKKAQLVKLARRVAEATAAGNDDGNASGKTNSSVSGSESGNEAESGDANQRGENSSRDGEADDSGRQRETDAQSSSDTNSKVTVVSTVTTDDPEIAQQREAHVKDVAKEQLAVGLEAENDKDYTKATKAYVDLIKVWQDIPGPNGRPVASEEIAKCLEGYGRMAELASHPEVAQKWEQKASEVRSRLSD